MSINRIFINSVGFELLPPMKCNKYFVAIKVTARAVLKNFTFKNHLIKVDVRADDLLLSDILARRAVIGALVINCRACRDLHSYITVLNGRTICL